MMPVWQHERQCLALPEASPVLRLIRCVVAGRRGLDHIVRLTVWIRDVNSERQKFCANAHQMYVIFQIMGA
jgi:hypothetical protein